jgi:hypothetical protein
MPKTALILMTYDRKNIFEASLMCLSRQTTRDYDLYICDNSNWGDGFIKNKLAEWATRLKVNVEVVPMGNKYSIWGRHVLAQKIAPHYDTIVFVDDDELFNPQFMQTAISSVEENVLKSFWAWECQEDYWVRRRLRKTQTGNYSGCGGFVAKTDFWSLPEMVSPPEKFWIIDDLWSSYAALKNGYTIQHLEVPISFTNQKNSTYTKIRDLKSQFYREYIYPLYW